MQYNVMTNVSELCENFLVHACAMLHVCAGLLALCESPGAACVEGMLTNVDAQVVGVQSGLSVCRG